MGRQILFHMLPEDCNGFLRALRGRDPVAVVDKDSASPEVVELPDPCKGGVFAVLWNRSLLPSLEREFIAKSDRGPYYRVSDSLPVLEFSLPSQADWDGKPALTQGRIYASFEVPNEGLRRWYEWAARWIRRNFAKESAGLSGGYVGPAALEWHERGGILLPFIRPPVTPAWQAFVSKQHARRPRHPKSPT